MVADVRAPTLRAAAEACEPRRRDADDRVWIAGDLQSTANRRRTRTEAIAPERVTDDDGAITAGHSIFVVGEGDAAARWCDPEDVESS